MSLLAAQYALYPPFPPFSSHAPTSSSQAPAARSARAQALRNRGPRATGPHVPSATTTTSPSKGPAVRCIRTSPLLVLVLSSRCAPVPRAYLESLGCYWHWLATTHTGIMPLLPALLLPALSNRVNRLLSIDQHPHTRRRNAAATTTAYIPNP
jgi:hypothetical protein